MTTQNTNTSETITKDVIVLSASERLQENINVEKRQSYLLHGDSYNWLKKIPENSMDSVVCDPPYLLNFMGKDFDREKGNPADDIEFWKLVLKTMKPGAHLLAAGIGRTHHRVMVAIEDAGFEIRDCVYHVFGSGFPKSHNIGKAVDKLQGNEREEQDERGGAIQKGSVAWSGNDRSGGKGSGFKEKFVDTKGSSPYEGWGTALKPAVEIWTLARKPLSESTIAENVLKWGTGGINIDGCRVGDTVETWPKSRSYDSDKMAKPHSDQNFTKHETQLTGDVPSGRFPANFIHDGSDEVVGLFPETKPSRIGKPRGTHKKGMFANSEFNKVGQEHNDSGSAARFFYCAKASKKERYVYLTCNCQTVKLESWPKQDQNLNEQTDGTSPEADTYEEQSEVDLFSNTSISGKKKMEKSLSDTHSITSTTSKQTTDSAISSSSMLLNTNESTEGVNLETENGGSPAQSVGNSSKLQPTTGISPQKDGHFMGVVVPATSAGWYRKSVCVDCGSEVRHNGHPTQKPTSLMQYLVRLVTPVGGTVLDPFMGSGSTGKACVLEGFDFIGIELDPEYCKIAEARIKKINILSE